MQLSISEFGRRGARLGQAALRVGAVAAIGATFLLPAAADLPREGLAGCWRFGDGTAGAVADCSGTGSALRLESRASIDERHGAPALQCGDLDTAARLDPGKALEWKTGLTLAVWVRAERKTRYEPLFLQPHANPNYTTPVVGLYLSEGCPCFGILGQRGKLILHGPELPRCQWTLIAVTSESERTRLWVDGRVVAESAQRVALPPAGGAPWYVGRGEAHYFRGAIGEVMAWSRALSATEIAALHATTASRYPATPQAAAQPTWRDRTVMVASPGNVEGPPWRERPTRPYEGLDGFGPPSSVVLDAYGGRLDQPPRVATGFFRTERIDGRWWLVTPDGHCYWNLALNHVVPPAQTTPAGTGSLAEDATRTLRTLGFNGLGTSSATALRQAATPLPWCIRMSFAATFARELGRTYATAGHAGFAEQCVPVFHPDFASWAERYASRLKSTAEDPLAVGIFTDNELQCSVDLLDRHLRLDAGDPYLRPGREAAQAWLRRRGRPLDPAVLTLEDRFEFIAYIFGCYSRIVHDAVRKFDPHHLILGSRFFQQIGQFNNPAFWAAIGPWVDVVSLNYYGRWGVDADEMEEWSARAQRPLLITEWYAKAADAPGLANTHGAGWLVRTQEDRGLFYQHFALSALECRALVGIHYFKYLDDPSESRALDAVGGANKGMFRSDGTPWLPLTQRAQTVNTALYPLLDFFDGRRRDRR